MSAEDRSEAFTTGKEATRESPVTPGRYETDIAVRSGEGLGTASVTHGWDLEPRMPRRFRMPASSRSAFAEGGLDNQQGTLFRPRTPEIDEWHGTQHPDSKLAKAYALGRAYNFAKEVSGRNPEFSTVRTQASTDAANRLLGTDTPASFFEHYSQDELNEYGDAHSRWKEEGIDGSLGNRGKRRSGRFGRRDVSSRILRPDQIEEARNTAANAKKIAQGQQFKTLAQRRINAQLDKAKRSAGIQPTLPGFEQ
jgi:hypothetical protein